MDMKKSFTIGSIGGIFGESYSKPFETGDKITTKEQYRTHIRNPELLDRVFTVRNCKEFFGLWCVILEEVDGKDSIQPSLFFKKVNDRKNRIDSLNL